jgi:hypothetical protein
MQKNGLVYLFEILKIEISLLTYASPVKGSHTGKAKIA